MKYYLHYISNGKNGIYGQNVFIKEAKQIGVNRSLPYFIIKKLKWRDKILLANFESCHIGETKFNKCDCFEYIEDKYETRKAHRDDCEKCKGTGKIKKLLKFQDGIAHIFGYFIISSLNITASTELKEKLYSKLDIISSNNNTISIKRSCGNYIIASSHVVKNSLEDIIEKANKLSKEMNEKIKYFIGGNFYAISEEWKTPEITLKGINFSRSLIEVDFYNLNKIEKISQQVGFIKNYNKKTYIPIKERK